MPPVLYCTAAPNDADLVAALGSLAIAIPIPHGDCVFWGVKEDGKANRVLIERKKIGDMSSCILGGRYMQQLRAAHDAGFDTLILIVEGQMRPSPEDGTVEVPGWVVNRKGWKQQLPVIPYSRFDQYLSELSLLAGVTVKRSRDVAETAAIIKALWNMFQSPPSAHTSLHSLYSLPDNTVLLTKPSIVRRVAKELDGIGWERSIEVARCFSSVAEMCRATIKDWEKIPGIGKKTAEKAVRLLNGGSVNE